MATYNSDGTTANINTLIAAASSGDIITIPAGSFTWGAGSAFVNCTKAITLQGAGTGLTIITVSSGAHSSGVIQVYAAATFKDFAIIPSSGKTNFGISASGWRITNILYNQAAAAVSAYFALINSGFGVIDNCDITGGTGSNELIFGQGPDTAWDTPYIPGTANAVFIENCDFRNLGYVCDANSNAIFVVRYNRIYGQMKIDGHGINTNQSPVRGCRAMEIYGNVWTYTAGSNWAAVEVRGGVGFIWGNYVSGSSAVLGYYRLTDYAVNAPGTTSFGGIYQTPYNWPIPDQIGAGPGATGAQSGGGQPLLFFNNVKGSAIGTLRWDDVDNSSRYTNSSGYAIGSTRIGLSGGSVTAANYIQFSGDPRSYFITTGYTATSGTISITPALEVELPATRISGLYGAVANFRGQVGVSGTGFRFGPNQACIIENERDYKQTVTGFDGQSGIGSGSYSQMTAITPVKSGVYFWVSNTGSWNTTLPVNTAGQLYRWNTSSWELDYVPYQYPFYASGDTPPVVTYVYKRLGRYLKLRGLAPA